MKTYALLLSASALAINWAGPAWAQTNKNEDSQMLETVTVTAQRRSENLMQTAISASVITGDQLTAKNVVQVSDLQFVAPQITVDSFGQGINFNIRGIGKGEHNSATLTGVITYRDGTPTFPGYMSEEPYYDIKGIEVLRGPQGTFVGQNATGGAVFVSTNDPQINGGYSGYVMAGAGNYADVNLQGALNIPISDTFALRVAAYGERRDPFYEITNNDPATNHGNTDYQANSVFQFGAVRLGLLWKPTDRFSVTFKTDNDYLDNGPLAAGVYTNLCKNIVRNYSTYVYANPAFGLKDANAYDFQYNYTAFGIPTPPNVKAGCSSSTAPGAVANTQYTGDPLKFSANAPNRFLDKFTRNVLKLEYETPDGTIIRSIGSWQKGNTMYETDLDGTDLGSPLSATNARNYLWYDSVGESILTEEINIISPSDQRITWILGGFAQHDEYTFVQPWKLAADWPAGTDPFQNPLAGVPNAHVPGKTSTAFDMQGHSPRASWAVFGQMTGKLFSGLEAQVGWRWTSARVKNDFDIWSFGTHIKSVQSTKSYSFDYKASLNWTIDESDFVYGFIATGFKPGGLNTPTSAYDPKNPATTQVTTFRPERITSYETGYKGTWFDGHVRAQFDAYYYEYNNFQVTISNPDVTYLSQELNTTKPTIMYGAEGELEAVFGNFAASAGIGWLHASLGEFWANSPVGKSVYAFQTAQAILPCPSTGPQFPANWAAIAPSPTYNTTCLNLKGHKQTYAPSLTSNINIEYRFDIGGGDVLTPRLSYSHASTQWATLFNDADKGDKLGVRNLLSAQLEWKHDEYILTAYATNLTDLHYVSAMESNLAFGAPPRQYGIRLLKVF